MYTVLVFTDTCTSGACLQPLHVNFTRILHVFFYTHVCASNLRVFCVEIARVKLQSFWPVLYKHCIQREVVNVVLLVTSCYRNSVKVWLYSSCNPKVQLYLTTFEPNGSLCLHLSVGCQYKVTRSVTIPPYIVC